MQNPNIITISDIAKLIKGSSRATLLLHEKNKLY